YPSLRKGLKEGKIRKGEGEKQEVTIRQSKYDEFKELWEKINQKVFIDYKIGDEENVEHVLLDVLKNGGIEGKDSITFTEQKIEKQENTVGVINRSNTHIEYSEQLAYNKFLDIISKGTCIPITTIHNSMVRLNTTNPINPLKFFTRKTAQNTIKRFNEQISTYLIQKLEYKKIDVSVHPTALTKIDGTLRKVAAHRLGV
ncbi:hypothetical protein, partial [Mycobacterium tuberculosis]